VISGSQRTSVPQANAPRSDSRHCRPYRLQLTLKRGQLDGVRHSISTLPTQLSRPCVAQYSGVRLNEAHRRTESQLLLAVAHSTNRSSTGVPMLTVVGGVYIPLVNDDISKSAHLPPELIGAAEPRHEADIAHVLAMSAGITRIPPVAGPEGWLVHAKRVHANTTNLQHCT
jgi:hypothetical protein